MALGIYKADQGYWTRMMTALGAGALVLAFAGWIAAQFSDVSLGGLDQRYVQGGAAGLIVILGAALVYWLVYQMPRSSEFLIATEGEMKKVNWSTPKEIMGSTWVVIGISLVLVISLLLVDLAFSRFFHWIKVLQVTG